MRASCIFLPALMIAGFAIFACGDSVSNCMSSNTCSYSDDGGASSSSSGSTDGGFDVVAPPGCDLTKSPKDSPACVDPSVAVFVSPTGDDSAAGSKSLPFKTIPKALAAAASRGLPRVYVCEGTYDANVEVTFGISLYGGLSCAWTPSDVRPKLAPTKGVALRVTKVSGAVRVFDFEIVGSSDQSVPGDSAIGVFVTESQDVTLSRCMVTAGSGVAGAIGTTSSNWTGQAASGNGTTSATGGAEKVCACSDGMTSSKGGRGGTVNGLVPQSGTAVPVTGTPNAGLNGDADCSAGTAGADGSAGVAGAAAPSPGKLTSAGWDSKQAAGGAGAVGNPGQGGGGGGSKASIGIGGGGGSCGGCGGAGGGGGTNGGSSFALLSFQSKVSLEGGTFSSGSGGAGGEGGAGQGGQPGATFATGACNGGIGGDGAGGSGGGGGAGGHSAAIAFVGTEPSTKDASLQAGAKGGAGQGGQPGTGPGNAGVAGTPGPEGKSQNILPL